MTIVLRLGVHDHPVIGGTPGQKGAALDASDFDFCHCYSLLNVEM
ncbi:hypothetical protein ES703_68987 [subsurface metagenome]